MKIAKLLQSTMLVLGLIGVTQLVPVATASAAGSDVLTESCETNPSSALCTRSQSLFGPNSIWTKIINTLIFVIGAVAVIMIVIGGFRYVISGGDASQVNSAKNTILYAVVGLVVALMSYGIVNFVLAGL
jgi:hypothetical protein